MTNPIFDKVTLDPDNPNEFRYSLFSALENSEKLKEIMAKYDVKVSLQQPFDSPSATTVLHCNVFRLNDRRWVMEILMLLKPIGVYSDKVTISCRTTCTEYKDIKLFSGLETFNNNHDLIQICVDKLISLLLETRQPYTQKPILEF